MCQHVASLSASLIQAVWTWTLSACWHKSAHVNMCWYADMCWYVPTCANMWHQYQRLWYQSFGSYLHSGMCQHIWTCRHVLIRAEMCWHVRTCANMWKHSRHLWYHPFAPYCIADVCQHMWTCQHVMICVIYSIRGHADMCRYVLICADMCQHVVSLSVPLIPIIWTLFACWHVSTHVDMPTCVNMCRHVPMCVNM